MMCYRGATFCVFRECAEFSSCPAAFTEEVDLESKVWWRLKGGKGDPPISYADRSYECFPEKRKEIGMNHEEKIEWMNSWAEKNGLILTLEGECGFGRICVGILDDDIYPDYEWTDDDCRRIDNNGDVWRPEDAYHKHTCVAVLGRGERAERQLYDWLKWFDDNGFVVERGRIPGKYDHIMIMLGKHKYSRMVKRR